jgi:hypothetical protein
MTQPGFSSEEIEALRKVADPLSKILSLQRFKLSASMNEELGVVDDGHSTQSNHCSSRSISCTIPFDEAAVVTQ